MILEIIPIYIKKYNCEITSFFNLTFKVPKFFPVSTSHTLTRPCIHPVAIKSQEGENCDDT